MKKNILLSKSLVRLLLLALLPAISSCGSEGNDMNTSLIPILSGKSYGYINLEGVYMINPQFDEAGEFFDRRALVRKGNLYGYIDEKGTYVIPPKYVSATPFSEGVAWTVEADGAPTLIDTDGNTQLVAKDAEKVWVFTEGMAKVLTTKSDNSKVYGFLDRKGQFAITPQFDQAYPFSDGMANVRIGKNSGYVDKKGRMEISDSIMKCVSSFFRGYAIVENGNDDYGLIDSKGRLEINPQFSEIYPDGDMLIVATSGDEKNYGWCDRNGKFIINPQFRNASFFSNNDYAPVKIGNSWGYIDRKGKIVINPQFDDALSFINNKVAFVKTGDKVGIIDKDGKYVANPQFDELPRLYMLNMAYGIPATSVNYDVTTRYFNVEKAVDMVMDNVTKEGIKGITLKTPISKIIKDFNIHERNLYGSYGATNITSAELGKNLFATFSIEGDFFQDVSDGWWGTTSVLVKNATPKALHYSLQTTGLAIGKERKLFKALADRMNLKINSDKNSATGNYGRNHIWLTLNENEIRISMTPGGKNYTDVPDSTLIIEELIGNQTSAETFEGKINNKYGIVMQLLILGSDVSGTYHYTSRKSPITLSGTLDSDGSIRLEEKTGGKITGQFAGTYTPSEISGTWISADGKTRMPFVVERSNN